MIARRLAAALGVAAVALVWSGPTGGEDLTDRFEITSGSWSAEGDDGAVTRSPVFRARSRDRGVAEPELTLRFRIDAFASEGAHAWDGVHVGVRYASPDDLYYVSIARRDGTVAIKRKAGGRYETLASTPVDVAGGRWHEATVRVDDVDAGVRLRLAIDGHEVLEAVDDEAPLTAAGRVSLRSDNVDVAFDDVEVHESS